MLRLLVKTRVGRQPRETSAPLSHLNAAYVYAEQARHERAQRILARQAARSGREAPAKKRHRASGGSDTGVPESSPVPENRPEVADFLEKAEESHAKSLRAAAAGVGVIRFVDVAHVLRLANRDTYI